MSWKYAGVNPKTGTAVDESHTSASAASPGEVVVQENTPEMPQSPVPHTCMLLSTLARVHLVGESVRRDRAHGDEDPRRMAAPPAGAYLRAQMEGGGRGTFASESRNEI